MLRTFFDRHDLLGEPNRYQITSYGPACSSGGMAALSRKRFGLLIGIAPRHIGTKRFDYLSAHVLHRKGTGAYVEPYPSFI
jgi:hypothetical protein